MEEETKFANADFPMRERVTSILKEKKLDAALICDPYNIRYLSGFSGGTGYLYISKEKQALLTDSRYTTAAMQETSGFKIVEAAQSEGYYKAVYAMLLEENAKSIGFESERITYSEYLKWSKYLKGVDFVGLPDEFTALRRIKADWEIDRLRRAEAIGDKAFKRILDIIKPGMTEISVAAHIEFFMKEEGAEGLSFETIAASGKNSSMPHAIPTEKRIENGDFLTLDFGCIYRGYCSDMTRTVVVGKADKRQREIYEVVRQAQQAALDFIKEGYKGREIDKVARDVINKAGYGKYFGHGLGHGVGLYIHEEPRLSLSGEDIIKAGMVETVEPGIYIPDFGGVRIEDMVVVTKEGIINLTGSPKELIEI